MASITKPVTVNGFANLATLLKAAGMKDAQRLRFLLIDNPSTTVKVYVHFTNVDQTTGAGSLTGTDGIPLSSGAAPEVRRLQIHGDAQDTLPESNHIWLFTPSSIPITVAAVGI